MPYQVTTRSSAAQTMNLSNIEFPVLTPEEHFIINCLRSEFSGGTHHALPSASPTDMRWDTVFETALNWNTAPMLYRILKNRLDILTAQAVPNAVLKAMEAAYIKTYMVNQSNFADLTAIIKTLTAADIRMILLKGAHLAPFVYQDIGMRWMADIDILIMEKDLQKANELLTGMSYAYPEMKPAVWDDFGKREDLRDQAAVIDWYKTEHMHLIYSNPNAIQNLELHWGISRRASPFAIDTEGLWERAGAEKLNGQKVWVLSPPDLLLHISLHDAYYHHLNLFGLRPCCDVAVVIRHFSHKIDWKGLQSRAREWGIEKYVYLMLRLSKELLGCDIPVDMLEARGLKRCSDQVFRQAASRLLGKEIGIPAYKGMKYPSKIHVFNFDESLFQKIGFFLKRIPISREELAFRYGLPVSSTRIWLYYLTRLAALILSYSRIYVPYFWFQLNRRNYRAHYTLDLWIKSPTSRKQIPLR